MTEQPKRKLMAALREKRARLGLVRLEVWVKSEHVARVRKYVARLTRTTPPTNSAQEEQ
jgi:hypothetical protein